MNRLHRNALRAARPYLVNNLDRLEDILDQLESARILLSEHREQIMSITTPRDRVRQFLDRLFRGGPTAFEVFLQALNDTGQRNVAENIESELANVGRDRATPEIGRIAEAELPIILNIPGQQFPPSIPFNPYRVQSKPRGYVLIVNVENYDKQSNIPSRVGSEKDVENLRSLFQDFNYSVGVLQDPTGRELERVVREFSQKNEHDSVDACCLFVLSHGVQHHIIARDGVYVSINDILSCFTNPNCPRLAGKPKLLVVQACRGELRDHRTVPGIPSTFGISRVDHSLDPQSWLSLPYMSDCVIVYSTLPGFVSWRSEVSGSWYMTNFVNVFRTHGHRCHVMDMLAEVNNRLVEEAPDEKICQISQPVNTLRRPFFLYTKE